MPEFKLPEFKGGGIVDPFHGRSFAGEISRISESLMKSVDVKTPNGIDPNVRVRFPEDIKTSITSHIKEIPTTSEGVLGKELQSGILDDLANPRNTLIDNAYGRAIEEAGNSPSHVTSEKLKSAYDAELKKSIDVDTTQYKKELSDAVTKAINDPRINVKEGSPGKALLDKMIDNPTEAKAQLEADAKKIETDTPGWKEKVKEKLGNAGKQLLEYGGKGLLVLAIVGSLIPGALDPIEKLAEIGGEAAGKIITVAAGILSNFLGPFFKNIWAKFKPIVIVLGIFIVLWMLKTLLKK